MQLPWFMQQNVLIWDQFLQHRNMRRRSPGHLWDVNVKTLSFSLISTFIKSDRRLRWITVLLYFNDTERQIFVQIFRECCVSLRQVYLQWGSLSQKSQRGTHKKGYQPAPRPSHRHAWCRVFSSAGLAFPNSKHCMEPLMAGEWCTVWWAVLRSIAKQEHVHAWSLLYSFYGYLPQILNEIFVLRLCF